MDDTLHIHGSHDGGRSGGKVVDKLHPLLLLDTLQKPRCHLAEVHPDSQLHGDKGDTGPLSDCCHHCSLTVPAMMNP